MPRDVSLNVGFARRLKPHGRIAGVLIVALIALALAGATGRCGGAESLSHARGDEPRYDPIEMYAEQAVEGWKVLVNRALLADDRQALRERTIKVLAEHLFRISRVVPTVSLEKLREVPIWIEQAHPRHPCLCYHASPDWLREHDMNPQKAGAVEIANCANFLTWTINQPWMVLHELAHAFHHRVVGHNHAELKMAYRQALESKAYDSVLHIRGERRRHYALNNDQEYFAEATEAYFGTNDFYPFVRAELKQHDPQVYQLIERLWLVREND
jgi:hypothetical protein